MKYFFFGNVVEWFLVVGECSFVILCVKVEIVLDVFEFLFDCMDVLLIELLGGM